MSCLRRLLPILLVVLATPAPAASAALTNQLKNHPSPYLAMHADDPVAWQDWTAAAVERARSEDKLLYVSIGYFSCHWCHVMQRESYRNAEIAALLNRHFVPVKIDRELEPALDARMIAFAEATRGMGGWPLNVFITPDGHPLYAVLYAPPREFEQIVRRLQTLWSEERDTLKRLARQDTRPAQGPGAPAVDIERAGGYARQIVAAALALADPVHAGFGEQSKFPSVPQLDFLLERYRAVPEPKLGEFLRHTLNAMARLGLQDHLGGGFFRYTVDPGWKTPHFEKMLYDNALLARLYLRAAAAFAEPDYAAIARRTLDFMERDLRSSQGALIASLSAVDDRNVEGGYYLWQRDELARLLTPTQHKAFERAFGLGDPPAFDDGYLPIPALAPAEVAGHMSIETAEAKRLLAQATDALRTARSRRGLPRDHKLLAGWNGLALAAFADAARELHEPRYRETARGIRDYVAQLLWDGKELRRAVDGRRRVGAASLEDYAYVAHGLAAWARASGRDEDYALAARIARAGWRRHYGSDGWRLAERSLIGAEAGQDIVADGPMPSPSSVLIDASLDLAARTGDTALRVQALGALNSGHALLQSDPFWYASHVGVMLSANVR